MEERIADNGYDLHITPAEIAARMEREGTDYRHIPEHEVHPDEQQHEILEKEILEKEQQQQNEEK